MNEEPVCENSVCYNAILLPKQLNAHLHLTQLLTTHMMAKRIYD